MVAGVITKVNCMSHWQVKTELLQIISLSIFVEPSAFAEKILNCCFAFSDVAFSEGTMQGAGMSLPLIFCSVASDLHLV